MEVLNREYIEGKFQAVCNAFRMIIIRDDRDVKGLLNALTGAMACAFDYKALLLQEKKKWVDTTDAEAYAQFISRLSQKGMAFEERKLYTQLQSGTRVVVDLEWVDFVISSLRQFEMVLQMYLRATELEMKLSFEGHE